MTPNQPSQPIFPNRVAPHMETDAAARDDVVEVSVVAPLYDEAESLAELTDRIETALSGRTFEIIFVDDGSQDGSWDRIQDLARKHPFARGFRHRRNFGKAEALSTGFQHARGRYVITIDADLQDDPKEFAPMLAKLEKGYDLVSGWKRKRNDPLSKTIPSRFFNFTARAISGIPIHDFNCGLKAYRKEATQDLDLYGELHRFIPILAHAQGFRIAEVPVLHHARQHGISKYGWGRLAKGFLDLITVTVVTRYLRRPGHFFGGIGLLAGGLGAAILAYLSFMKIAYDQNIGSRPLFFFGILATLFGGQLISTGIIGEFFLRHRPKEEASQRSYTDSATE